jgi:hypothetical protein
MKDNIQMNITELLIRARSGPYLVTSGAGSSFSAANIRPIIFLTRQLSVAGNSGRAV